ncbi:MAG: hypothetical protein M4579_000392 [Chaenotheca gracillima]|nr:MAG: hypothetical protein M4579_000392 [Chaenotheca gracillima]
MSSKKHLDAHAAPPQALRQFYKTYQKSALSSEEADHIIDFDRELHPSAQDSLTQVGSVSAQRLKQICEDFHSSETGGDIGVTLGEDNLDRPIYECLQIIPRLLPPKTQLCLLSRMLHRDLSSPRHKTNVHAHYNFAYPQDIERAEDPPSSQRPSSGVRVEESFFNRSPLSRPFSAKDPIAHKPIDLAQFLNKKLRWMTLGGQYDWTRKVYPDETPPAFPEDLARFLHGLFPSMRPEAAIVNFYSPGDRLSLHRDVSEYCDNGLISVSLGCDGLFIVGLDDDDNSTPNDETSSQIGESSSGTSRHLIIRLRSGDAVYMSRRARYAWHGVPRIISGTCPAWMESWPASAGSAGSGSQGSRQNEQGFKEWKGWMANKRINLNVRQIRT